MLAFRQLICITTAGTVTVLGLFQSCSLYLVTALIHTATLKFYNSQNFAWISSEIFQVRHIVQSKIEFATKITRPNIRRHIFGSAGSIF